MNCGCAEVVTPGLLDLFEARARLIEAARPIAAVERLALEAAGGQGSHMLGAASQAHGYLMIDADRRVEEGHVYGFCPGTQFLD